MQLNTNESWLAGTPWEAVVAANQKLCDKPATPYRPGEGFERARQEWEKARQQAMTFRQFLDFCRRCHGMSPFAFFNGNTFACVLAGITEPVCQKLPSLQAAMLRNAAAHYVAGAIRAGELNETCQHVDELLRPPPPPGAAS